MILELSIIIQIQYILLYELQKIYIYIYIFNNSIVNYV